MTKRPLSILHFSTADIIGGSARSAYRIHSGLRAAGHQSRMLVGIKASDDPDVATICHGPVSRLADRIANKVADILGLQYRFVPSNRSLVDHPWVREADVIQLYNTHGGYFETSMVGRLSALKPLVWRLSDLWPMTGHCAYPGNCERWRAGCGDCPDLTSYPAIGKDRTAYLFANKKEVYAQSKFTVVAPSSWTRACASQSPLLGHFPVSCIPNGLNEAAFRPMDRTKARQELGVDPAKKIILFTAHVLDDNPRKGGDILLDAIRQLDNPMSYALLLVGQGGESWREKTATEVKLMGYVDEPEALSKIYAAADVVALPSVVENLPNVLIEALACGRAAVAFNAGGMADGVRHLETGVLVEPGDADDFANGLRLVLNEDKIQSRMELAARSLFEEEFAGTLEIARHVNLYRDLVSELEAV